MSTLVLPGRYNSHSSQRIQKRVGQPPRNIDGDMKWKEDYYIGEDEDHESHDGFPVRDLARVERDVSGSHVDGSFMEDLAEELPR